MFVFSTQHDWQENPAVQQILVFPNQEVEALFKEEYAEQVKIDGIKEASDSNMGAIYKLRAVRESDGKWSSVIRCGITGKMIWEEGRKFMTSKDALFIASNQLREDIKKKCDLHIHNLLNPGITAS